MLAIIPARGGSKGLPGKNIRELLGKPLIAYTVEAALASENIDRVIISTDDDQIAQVAVNYGAECPFMRPRELAMDTATSIDTFIYTIDRLSKNGNERIDDFIVLQPTSPLRTSEDINGAIKLFKKNNADSVVSYTEEDHPIFWHKYVKDDGSFEDVFSNDFMSRQNYRKTYHPTGAIYVFKYSLIKEGKYYTDKSYAYIMPRVRANDIDTLEDFEYAEFLLNKRWTDGLMD